MREWTEQQRKAIESPARKIICSAAAGSGKTAVMIERIIRMLREGAPPDTFLVVTFTNAAASEMKEKIRTRLREGRKEKNLRDALDRIDLMQISTIHAFCQQLIRQEFQAVGVDPFFGLCDPAVASALFAASFRSVCASLQREEDEDYKFWKKAFGRKETEELVSSVYHFMMSLPDPFGWLARSCGEVPLAVDPGHPWFAAASELVRDKILSVRMILRQQFLMFSSPEAIEAYRAVWKADSEMFHVKQLWADGQELTEEQRSADFRKLPGTRGLNSLEIDWKERYTSLRDELKQTAKEIDPFLRLDGETIARDDGNMKTSLRGLRKLVERTAKEYAARKARRRVLDFSDLEQFALRILSQPDTRAEVCGRYPEVFVDECQDVSRVQDEIIQRLYNGEGHLFMVGDVKQSIYRFRLADPNLFLNRMEEYRRPESDGECLELQTNFRSRAAILETVNTVFRDVMRKSTAELDYTDREALLPGRKETESFPVAADVITLSGEDTRLSALADHAARQIGELLQEHYRYRDVVILMPQVSTDGPKLAELLEKRGVPVFFDGGKDFYELEEVKTFLQLLSWIDCPVRDEDLIAVLRNAPFFFTEEELSAVRLACMEKDVSFRQAYQACLRLDLEISPRCRQAEDRFRHWRRAAAVVPLGTFVRMLCSDSHQYAMAGAAPAGNTARKNLRILFRQAESAEKSGIYTLREFLAGVSEQGSGGDQRAASSLAEGDDVVRIMTMHKSKGLQFPVVFCMGLDRSVAGRRSGKAALDADLGICLKYKRPELRYARDTAAAQIFAWKKDREERAERIRLLYVAMTRAQERMFLVVTDPEGDRMLWHAPAGDHRVLAAKDYMDWILPALVQPANLSTGYAQPETCWKIRAFDSSQQRIVENSPPEMQFSTGWETLINQPCVDELWKNSQQETRVSRMAKKSVTSLLKQAEKFLRGTEPEEETPEDKRMPERFSDALRRTELKPYPACMMPPPEKQGAWRGTVIHHFLSLLDPRRLREAASLPETLEAMKEEMLLSGVFTREEAAVIQTEDAVRWLESPLGSRMLRAADVRREWGFNLYRPDRNLLVQGVIDCAFLEEDGWVLVDYKTDRAEDEEGFVETYRPQLAWYAEAVRELTGKPVKEAWLYALSRGRAYRTDAPENR